MAIKSDEIDDLAKKNPKVNVKQLREANELLEELRKGGLRKRQYEIETPYESRPRRVKDEEAAPVRRGRR